MPLQKRTDDTTPHPAKLTAKDFWLLAESGAFANHARTELIEGEIWAVNSVHRWHARVMGIMNRGLAHAIEAAGLRFEVFVAGSVAMSDDSVPEPDISVITAMHNESKTIEREELNIAVEITDSTAHFDLGRKAKLYARHGVPEYWVVHRDRREVIQMWSPGDDGYAERREVKFGERIEAATIAGLAVETSGLNS
ncbi:MAG TPA: Uma2 family endonuclease [Allosphingosinicella sp.]|jgi:Uma2 family endonuclease